MLCGRWVVDGKCPNPGCHAPAQAPAAGPEPDDYYGLRHFREWLEDSFNEKLPGQIRNHMEMAWKAAYVQGWRGGMNASRPHAEAPALPKGEAPGHVIPVTDDVSSHYDFKVGEEPRLTPEQLEQARRGGAVRPFLKSETRPCGDCRHFKKMPDFPDICKKKLMGVAPSMFVSFEGETCFEEKSPSTNQDSP